MISTRLTRNHIKSACGPASFQRGLNYWKEGRVLECIEADSPDPRIEIISAMVRGSGPHIYRQHIELRENTKGGVEIDGECSCPVGYDCKHVAAALLDLIDYRKRTPPADSGQNHVEGWLEKLKIASHSRTGTASESYPEYIPYRLLYVLSEDTSGREQRALQVTTFKVRKLKKGGFGKPAHIALENVLNSYSASEFAQPSDKEIARLLVDGNTFYYTNYSSHHALKSDIGELALQKMVLTGRCYWEDIDEEPLSLGAPRSIDFFWDATPEGHELDFEITPPAGRLARVGMFWYIDVANKVVGPVEHPSITSEQMGVLLDAPPIPQEQAESVSRRLLLETPEYDLEPPVELSIEKIDITGTESIPGLFLETIMLDDGQPMHCARLRFRYGPALLEQPTNHPVAQVVDGDTIYRIERDTEAENRAVDTLREAGLRQLLDNNGESSFAWGFPVQDATQTALHWHEFLEYDLPELEAQGWEIEHTDVFKLSFTETDDWDAELETSGTQWFTLTLGVDVDGARVNLLPVLVDILGQASSSDHLREMLDTSPHFLLPLDNDRWLKIPSERLRPIFETLVELYDREPLDKDGNLTLSRYQSVQIGDLLNDPGLRWRGADELHELSRKLQDFSGIEPVASPKGFNATLRAYQLQGLSWLQFLREFNFSGILADDMGLGKTVQTLAHILLEKQSGRMQQPALIIAPTSLMGNWRREAENFTPDLDVLMLHGPERRHHFHQINQVDIVLTTYPLLRRDKQVLLEHEFHVIVLDEAQAIKNPKAQTTQAVFELRGKHHLCLTGTPLENHLGELWSMFHFLMPGYLGPLERFNRIFRNPIEKGGDGLRREQLRKRIAPFMLRRTKAEVAAELPQKTEIIRNVTLEGRQRDLYESIRMAMDKKVRNEIQRKGFARSQIMILDALLKLRQVCCDPRLVRLPQAKNINKSAKLELLLQMLPEMIEEGRRILLFSQFTSMLTIIEKELKAAKIDYCKLTGQTRKRDAVISRFQDEDVPIFLISLKAGGVGLNLTAADTVIHYDPWWNPAVENQATDRAHRIGQKKAVFVYKLITEDSVEDKILALQQKKQLLADSIYAKQGESQDPVAKLTADDLNELLKPLENHDAPA